jgi:transposase
VRVLSREELPGGGIAVRVMMRAEVRSCPECGRLTAKVHNRREQAKTDLSLGGRRVVLVLVRRRLRCPFCKEVFTEPNEVCGWRRRLTKRLREELYQEAIHSTVKRVAEARGVSEETVRRALVERERESESREPVRYLGMDEFSVRKGQRYQTGFYDLTGRRVLGVVEGRTREGVVRFLADLEHPEMVEAVTMDMSGVYRSAVRESLRGGAGSGGVQGVAAHADQLEGGDPHLLPVRSDQRLRRGEEHPHQADPATSLRLPQHEQPQPENTPTLYLIYHTKPRRARVSEPVAGSP